MDPRRQSAIPGLARIHTPAAPKSRFRHGGYNDGGRIPKSARIAYPVSAGTMAFSVTNQVRPFSIKMTWRRGAFSFARR
jgi:hypothetical protein